MNTEKIGKKVLNGFLVLLLSIRILFPVIVFAEDSTPTDTPAPTETQVDQAQVNNSAVNTNTVDSNANTGNNTITDTTPTPTIEPNAATTTPSVDPEPTPSDPPTFTDAPSVTPEPNSISVDASNAATLTNDVSTTSNTGENTTTSEGSNVSDQKTDPTPTPAITVQTGDGVSIVAGDNTINTTSVNSDFTNQTINIFGDQTGNIDLSTLFQLVSTLITTNNNSDPVINIQITGVNNYAYLANTVVSSANTGNNTVNTSVGDVAVSTGNAESVVSLINKVNLTVVNSSIHLVTINIFGHLTGNIILPNIAPLTSATCASCGVSFNTQNQAVVDNTVSSTANTGENATTTNGDATITTGNAQSQSNIINLVNQTDLGVFLEYLFINNFGNWNGSFLGWDNFAPTGNGNLTFMSTGISSNGTAPSGDISSTTVNNTAYIHNDITSLANTGSNTIDGNNVSLKTGSAYSAVSLINFINSNFFNSLGFFGFINIFGDWDGNIGGADKFASQESSQEPVQTTASTAQENGGHLQIENFNNVGQYVLPGDTVTFFLKATNNGTGKVYGAKLHLFLIHNGLKVGGKSFDLGDIPVSRGVKISTGLVLSKDAPAGDYIARAVIEGTTGPDSAGVSAQSDSFFTIFGDTAFANSTSQTVQLPKVPVQTVLGTNNKPTPTSNTLLLLLLGLSLGSYLSIKTIRTRKTLQEVWQNSSSFKQKLLAIRILLL